MWDTKTGPKLVLGYLGVMVDNFIPIPCPCQKSLLSEWALAFWIVVGTLWSQDLGLWNKSRDHEAFQPLCSGYT